MRKLVGLFAAAAIVVAACGGTSATQAPASVAAPPPLRRARGPRVGRSAVGVAARGRDQPVRHAPTRPTEATAQGGTVIIGDWQEATQFNPYYLGQVTEANVASLVWHSLLAIADDFKYIPQLAAEPIPTTENGGVKVPGETATR